MKNAKKLLSILILGTVICTHTYNVYQTSYAAEAVVAGGLASAGVALLGLGAIAGVGMELDNNRRFNELSDEEKERIENGLATDFNDVALQRGASVEKIKNWTTDLCNGVLDKSSECWGIFKDWVKSIDLSLNDTVPDSQGYYKVSQIFPYTCTFNYSGKSYTQTISSNIKPSNGLSQSHVDDMLNRQCQAVSIRLAYVRDYYAHYYVTTYDLANSGMGDYATTTTYNLSCRVDKNDVRLSDIYTGSTQIPIKFTDSTVKFVGSNTLQAELNGQISSSIGDSKKIFSTNTDYLEKLKGQDEDVIDVIDVTDIKNPIIESRPNSLANINWNRGTKRTNNNKDDDNNKMVTGLVPMDVWYEQIDDEQEQMQNAVVVYDNYIQEHPEEKDTYFISTTPITNINNYFNTLPVVNIPATGTVVNNNYEYNNYNNNNVTIYQEPYSAGIIPTFPDFSKKFPFCIPFDLYEFFVVFLAEKEAPKIEVPFPVLDNTQHQLTVEHITIDLAPYEYLSDVLRVMLFVLFCVGLMILTRQLIKG